MVFYNSRLAKLLKVNGITLWPFIFISYSKENTPESLVIHERVHLKQYVQYWIIGFLVLYLYEYCKGRFQGMSHYKAYINISFEKAAYLISDNINKNSKFTLG